MSSDPDAYGWTPMSPSSGVGTLDSRGFAYEPPTDENLPEVVPGSTTVTGTPDKTVSSNSPQQQPPNPNTVSSPSDGSESPEAVAGHGLGLNHVQNNHPLGLKALEAGEERDPKYPVVFDDAPKIASTPESISDRGPRGWGPPGSPQSSVPWEPLSAVEERSAASLAGGSGASGGMAERRICGFRRKIFFLILVIALVVAAVAIGAGVGGGIAAGNAREKSGSSTTTSSAASTAEATSTGTSSPTTTTTTTSSSASPTPTYLNNATDYNPPNSGFAFQAFSGKNFTGEVSPIIIDEGSANFTFHGLSYVWLPNNTGCCLTFCQGENDPTGWHCTVARQPAALGWFDTVYIWCTTGASDTDSQQKCH